MLSGIDSQDIERFRMQDSVEPRPISNLYDVTIPSDSAKSKLGFTNVNVHEATIYIHDFAPTILLNRRLAYLCK